MNDVPSSSGDRSTFFPAIEKKYGQPMQYWFDTLQDLGEAKYQEQINVLREGHGFSQAHANAVVMFVRGSTSSKRFDGPETYLRTLSDEHEKTTRAIFDAVTKKHPKMELVMAWNKPTLRLEKDYILGVSSAKNHILLLPFGDSILSAVADRLDGYIVNKKTIQVPVDWKVDGALLNAMVQARLKQL